MNDRTINAKKKKQLKWVSTMENVKIKIRIPLLASR